MQSVCTAQADLCIYTLQSSGCPLPPSPPLQELWPCLGGEDSTLQCFHCEQWKVMYYISTDATLTSANLNSALTSLSDDEVEKVLGGHYCDSREQRITNWIMMHYEATWEGLIGWCFYHGTGNEKEVKKNFKRKLGMLLIQRAHKFPCSLIQC